MEYFFFSRTSATVLATPSMLRSMSLTGYPRDFGDKVVGPGLRRTNAGLNLSKRAHRSRTVDGAADPASGKAWRVDIDRAATMYSSLVSVDSEIVRALTAAAKAAVGASPETYYASNAFDQGYLNHIGIEACTYGPGEERFAHTDFDLASVDRTRDAAKVYAALIVQRLT